MASIAEVRMLNEAISGIGDDALKRRQLQQQQDREMQQLALQREIAGANESHQSASLDLNRQQLDFSKQTHADALGLENKKNDQSISQADIADKQSLMKIAMSLNATGQLSDEGRDQFNSFIKSDKHLGTTGIQLQKPDPSFVKGQGKDSAIANALKTAETFRQKAQMSEDPEESDKLNQYAMYAEAWAKKQGEFSPVKVPPTKTETIGLDSDGHKTNSVTSYALPNAPTQSGDSSKIPTITSQEQYDALPIGAPYMDSFGKKAVKKK